MERGRERKTEREGGSEQDRGRDTAEDDRLFYFPLPENPFRTHARSIEDISQTSTGSLKYRRCRCSPYSPFVFPRCLLHPLPPQIQHFSISFVSPWHTIGKKPFFSENVRHRGPPSVPCQHDRDHSGELDPGNLCRCSTEGAACL